MVKMYYPELEYYFSKYWETERGIFIDDISIPILETIELSNDSVFALLFNNGFDNNYYINTCKYADLNIYFSKPIKERLKIKYDDIYPYISDSTGETVFITSDDELTFFLDLLLQYRLYGDVTFTSETVEYDNIENNLCKLIFIYLDAMVNDNYNILLTSTLPITSQNDIVSNLFEIYVINEIYKKIKNSEYIENNEVIVLNTYREKQIMTEENLLIKYLNLTKILYGSEYYLYLNGELVNKNNYQINNNRVIWENDELDELLKEGDVLLFDYKYRVSV
jgi:hypothetical protein